MTRAGRALLVALVLWWVVGLFVLIPAVERGDLTRLVELTGQPPELVARFVGNLVARIGLALALVSVFVVAGPKRLGLPSSRHELFVRFVGPARPEVLGFLRFSTAAILFVSVAWEDVAGTAELPASMRDSHGLFALVAAIPGFDSFTSDASALAAFRVITLGVLGAAALGAFSRVTVPLGALLYFVVASLMRQPTWPYHTGLVPLYAMTVLAFFPTGDGLSFDAWRAGRRHDRADRASHEGAHEPTDAGTDASSRALYGWGRFAWVATLALPYTEAGLSKLCNGGLLWWEPVNMRSVLYLDSLNPMEFDFDLGLVAAPLPDVFFAVLGLSAVIGEVVMVFVLFSRRVRLVAPAVMITMHLGILLLQNILFFDLIFMLAATYAMAFFDRDGGPWDLRRRTVLEPSIATSTPPPRVLPIALGVALVAWTFAIELWPFTAMQMYSHKRDTGVVEYHRIIAIHDDGERHEERPEALLPALRDGRYRRVLRTCVDDVASDACHDFLTLLLARREADGIVSYEVEHRRWDFMAEPDAGGGDVVAVMRFPATVVAHE